MNKQLQAASLWFEDQLFTDLQHYIDTQKPGKIFFLVDENTHEKCLPGLLSELGDLPETEVLEVPSGEEAKSPEVLVQLWEAMAQLGADRSSLLVNVGGGVVTDLGGFLAGTYMRGISFINIPTSLLAMVDASSGGKTGINLSGLKNMVGLFLEPVAVGIHPRFLETLPMRERMSGFAEMLKHGLIFDPEYWQQLTAFDIQANIPALKDIRYSIQLKKEVVEKDFRETGLRKVLNFGHTLGHSIESASFQTKNPLLHGEAIILGLAGETFLSAEYHNLDKDIADEIYAGLKKHYQLQLPEVEDGLLLNLMKSDKKNHHGQLRITALNRIGEACPDVSCSEGQIITALNFLREYFGK